MKFENRKYGVSFFDWVNIQYIKARLFWKRQVRRLGVIFCKEDIGLYFLITLFWMVFGVAIYFWGQYCVATESEPYTILNVAWDVSEGWFSSVILSFAIGAFVRIGEYKKKIHAQHHIYVSTMEDFEGLAEPYLGEEGKNFHPLYCDKCLTDTISHIKKSGRVLSTINDNESTLIVAIVMERLEKLAEEVKTNSLIFIGEPLTVTKIDNVRWKFTKYVIDDNITPQKICELLKMLVRILNDIRQPWRADIEYKIAILQRLNKNQKNRILDDFYYKMLLQGHPFPEKVNSTIRNESLALMLKKMKQVNQ